MILLIVGGDRQSIRFIGVSQVQRSATYAQGKIARCSLIVAVVSDRITVTQ